jgi:glycosyltransferase involved in cell wall biosynthesis
LRHLIEGKENITLLPWQADTEAFYDSIDFLLIPSRFEGVPLVMLEALARGIPTLGSRRDGMRDLLPEAWLFDPGNGKDLATVFSKVRNSWPAVIGPVQKKVAEEMTLESFKRNFHRAVVRK